MFLLIGECIFVEENLNRVLTGGDKLAGSESLFWRESFLGKLSEERCPSSPAPSSWDRGCPVPSAC